MDTLIILSDLWGTQNADWICHYFNNLNKFFTITIYDCCVLGGIEVQNQPEEQIHGQFIHGGIDRAVEALLEQEKEIVHVLGFSIGGYIGWKAIQAGLKVKSLTAVSSTRLRHEIHCPSCSIDLYYGGNDQYRPIDDWFASFGLDKNIYKNETHQFYNKKEIAADLCVRIIQKIKPLVNSTSL